MIIDTDFILNKCPVGLIVFDRKMDIVYRNRKAGIFLNRFELPPEITAINKRIFDSVDNNKADELFPGEIYVTKQFNGSPSNWIFRFYIYQKQIPLIYLFILEETISNKLDINGIRQKFRLTRRETDVLRKTLDGLRNTEISEELEISEQTVKDHLSNVYKKTGVENRTGLMRALLYSLKTYPDR